MSPVTHTQYTSASSIPNLRPPVHYSMPVAVKAAFSSIMPPQPNSSSPPAETAVVTHPQHHHHHHHHPHQDEPQAQLCLRCAYPISADRSVYDVIKRLPDMLSHVGFAVKKLVVDQSAGDATSVSLTIRPSKKRTRSSDTVPGQLAQPSAVLNPQAQSDRPLKRLTTSAPASSCRVCVSSCCSTNSLCKARICGHRNEEVSHPTSPPPQQQQPTQTPTQQQSQQPQQHASRPPINMNRSERDNNDPHPHQITNMSHQHPVARAQKRSSQVQKQQQRQKQSSQPHDVHLQDNQQQSHATSQPQPSTHQPHQQTQNSNDHPLVNVSPALHLSPSPSASHPHYKNKSRSHSHQRSHTHNCQRQRQHAHLTHVSTIPQSNTNPYAANQPTHAPSSTAPPQRQIPVHELLPLTEMAARGHDEATSAAATAAAAMEAATVALASQNPHEAATAAATAAAVAAVHESSAWTTTTAPAGPTTTGVYDTVRGRVVDGLTAELATTETPVTNTATATNPAAPGTTDGRPTRNETVRSTDNGVAQSTAVADTTNENIGNVTGNTNERNPSAVIRPPPDLICTACNITFDVELELRRHQFIEHKDDKTMSKAICKTNGGRFLCLMHSCTQSFVRRHVMERHFKTIHLKLKEFSCPSCDHAFADSSTRDAHRVAVHEKRKPWQCDTCSRSFTQSSSLGKHRRRFHSQTNVSDPAPP